YGREARRGSQGAAAEAHILAQFGCIFDGYTESDIGEKAEQSRQAMTAPDGLDRVFPDFDQVVTPCGLELVRKGSGQTAVKTQGDRTRSVVGRPHASVLLCIMRRLARMTRTRSSRRALSAASTLRPSGVRP